MNGSVLPAIKYLGVVVFCRLTTDALFSPYKGSMLRGSLGASLRRGLCMTRQKVCGECILAANCIFPRIFNPLPAPGVQGAVPFCLETDMDNRSQYAAGELFSFGLKLFSYGVEYLPFFVQALRMAGERGMGSPRIPGKFIIESITCRGKAIYDPETDNLDVPQCQNLGDARETAPAGRNDLSLRLRTPLRHKADNHFSATLEFTELFHLILRRVRALCLIDGNRWRLEPERYSGMRRAASAVRITENNLRWHDWTRYSSRQEAYMKFGGLMGRIVYSGDMAIFNEMLHFAQVAHIGKQTSFGLGRVDAEYCPS